jgi:hypothetical protein
MAGRFSRKVKAAAAHRMVVEPRRGKTPRTIPKDRLKAIFSGVIPWVRRTATGAAKRRWKKLCFMLTE